MYMVLASNSSIIIYSIVSSFAYSTFFIRDVTYLSSL